MKRFLPILLLLVCACACAQNNEPVADDNSIAFMPDTLKVKQPGGFVEAYVSASDAFQAYGEDSWISNVEPPYMSSGEGSLRIKIDNNPRSKSRESNVVIKCGNTVAKIPVVQEGVPNDTNIVAPEGYTLVWHDEFDNPDLGFGLWKFENWAPRHVNNELQRYVAGGELDGKKTASLKDGALNIVAQKHNGQVISARMNTRESWLYGYMEAKIWLPKGKGTWPAFWMMPVDQSDGWPTCGEIDIMEEVGVDANYTSSSIHCKSYNHTIGTQKTKSVYTAGAEEEYHVYATEWTPEYIRSFVDGKEFFRFNNDGKGNKNTWPFNKAFYITLNLAWGGDWGGYAGVDESALPCTMRVEYVRVFQKQ